MALPAVLTEKRFRIVTVVLCGVLAFLSLLIIIPLGLTSSSAGGRCLLYADKSDFGPGSVCSYILAVAVLFQLLGCLARALLLAVALSGRLKIEELLGSKYVLLGCAVVDAIACILTLVSAGLLSNGFSVMCTNVFYPHSDRCGALDFYSLSTSSFVRNYYTRLNITQVVIWLSWLVWILLVVVDVLLLVKTDTLSELWGGARSGDASSNAIRRDRDTNQSQRSGVFLLFRSADSDTDSGPRTPPPRRPVPPRPPPAGAAAAGAGAGGSEKPLMEKC